MVQSNWEKSSHLLSGETGVHERQWRGGVMGFSYTTRVVFVVMAVLLGAFVLLMFGITIAKIKAGMQ